MDTKKTLLETIKSLNKQDGELGIEIEMEGMGLGEAHVHMKQVLGFEAWSQKADGSLRGESCEWVLKKPLDYAEASKALDVLYDCQFVKGVKFTPSRRCGIHIHVNVQDMTPKQIFNYICLYLVFENVLIRWAGAEREGNFFCLRADDAQYLSACLADAWSTGKIKALNGDQLRYAALNCYALFVHGSLEFRSLPTVTSANRIKIWMRLLLALKEASKLYANPKSIVVQYGGIGPEKLMESVFGLGCPLNQIADKAILMKAGLRNLQDVMITHPRQRKKTYSYHGAWQGIGEEGPMITTSWVPPNMDEAVYEPDFPEDYDDI